MKRYKSFREAVSKNQFIKAVNSYIEDNYTDKEVKIIQSYKSMQGVEKNTSLKLYRGLFFNNLTNNEIMKYFNIKSIEDKEMSYTRDYNEAMSFAYGSNIFSSNKKLDSDQLGVVIEYFFPLSDIIIDFKYVLENDSYSKLNIIEDNEVLVKIKNRNCKIIALITDVGVKKIR